MPYDRDEVIAAVTAYYDFITHLHVRPEDIRRPPPEGWSQISQERLSSLGKTDKVIDLLKHLPYVQNDENFDPILVWFLSGCCDYTGEKFQNDMEAGAWSEYLPDDTDLEYASWEKLLKPHPHIIALASRATKYGDYILCDTEDGEMVVWDKWEDDYLSFATAEACFAHLKQELFEMKLFPLKDDDFRPLTEDNDMNRKIKRLLTEHRWPDEGFDWSRFIAAARVEINGFDDIARYDE